MSIGPLQVFVVNFEDANFTGEIQSELGRLEDAGVLRVLDLLFVAKSETGEVDVLKTGDVHSGDLTQAVLGMDNAATEEALGDDAADVWYAADAIERAGGRQAAAEWVDADQIAALGVALP
jgi:hypothetical protein